MHWPGKGKRQRPKKPPRNKKPPQLPGDVTDDKAVYSKYRAKKTEVDGITFDSVREAKRYGTLKLMQLAGEITDLHLQAAFPLVINGVLICTYKSDFTYRNKAGDYIVEDVKGFITREYKMKRKLMKAIYGITIVET